MDDRVRVIAETTARLILHQFRIEHPSWDDDRTPVDAIAAWLGLQIETFHPRDYPRGTYGFMDSDEDEHLIWLCRDLNETLRRFTLAHELGHAILHCHDGKRMYTLLQSSQDIQAMQEPFPQEVPILSRADPCLVSDIQEEMTALLDQEQFEAALGIGHGYDPRSQREVAANIFAAELLMPLERIHHLYLMQHVQPAMLADYFGVSPAALLNRLAGLLKASLTGSLDLADASTTTALKTVQKSASVDAAVSQKKRFDEFQQAAIEAPTPALITAGPGSGKTSTLIGRVAYMVNEQDIHPQHILALTFSRKAAQEMEQRLAAVLSGLVLPHVCTFHAFCADLLRQYGSLVGLRPDFALVDEAEGYFMLRQLSNGFYLRHYQNLHAPAYYFPDLLKAISRAKDELISPEQYEHLAQQMLMQVRDDEAQQKAEKALEVAHVYKLYEKALQQRRDSDFGGLLVLAVRLFHEHPEILSEQQQRYQHILVDEFQDMNRASGVLLRELAGTERRVWVVGDANQAIYSFRGASPANISQFKEDYPGAVVLPLSHNYRSRPDLVTLAESFRCLQLEPGQESGKNQPVRLTQPDTYVTLAKATDEASELTGIVQDIRYKHANGYAYKDMVVLCRTRAQVQKVSRALAAAGLPVIERGGILEQEHIKDALAIILLLADNSGMGLLRAARQPAHPLKQSDIEQLFLTAKERSSSQVELLLQGAYSSAISDQGRASLSRLVAILQAMQRATDTWSALAHYLLIETTLVRDLLSYTQNKAWLSDYDRLLQIARHYDQQQQLRLRQREQEASTRGEPTPSRPTLQQQAREFLEYLSLLIMLRQDSGNREQEERDEQDGESVGVVRVMTVHASKGLEFPVVYLPFLVQRRFPIQQRANPVPAPTGMLPEESQGSKANKAHESGESCLFYVGVTRARDQLVLSYSEHYGKVSYKRSPYLDALEAGLTELRTTRLQWQFSLIDIADTAPSTSISTASLDTGQAWPSQPGADFINSMKPTIIHVSAIEAYLRCPRQYAYNYIYHFRGEDDAYRLFLQATQKTVAELRQQMQQGQATQGSSDSLDTLQQQYQPEPENLRELYSKQWQALGGHNAPFAALYEQHGHEIIEKLHRDLISQDEIKWEVRQDFTVEVAGKTVLVPIDRVEASTQGQGAPIKFVRARYGKHKGKPPAEMREMLYARAFRQAHPGHNVELHSHNMSTGEIMPVTITPKKEQSLYDEAEQALQNMERNAFPALPAEPYRCPSCPFFFICPA